MPSPQSLYLTKEEITYLRYLIAAFRGNRRMIRSAEGQALEDKILKKFANALKRAS